MDIGMIDDLDTAMDGVRLAQLAIRGMVADNDDKALVVSKLEGVLILVERAADAARAERGIEAAA